jgi:small-conductance mechanosensitive channel/CRP-like cAMP-binding protein
LATSWLTISDRIAWELAALGFFLFLGVAAFVPLRQLVHRAKLRTAYAVLILAVSVYLSLALVDPGRLHNDADRFTFWINRAVVGALLFAMVRIVDRLVVVPVLSRGGTTQVPRFIHQLFLILLSLFVVLMYGKIAFGWPINDFLTGGAVISIVIGLALQESLGNLFSGLVLQAAPPFVLGDFILAGACEGRVVDMTWRAVTLHTNDDNYVVIPNGTIAKEEIINYHAPTMNSARFIKIGLDYDLPPCDAVEVLERAAAETNGIEKEPAPEVLITDFADSAILYGLRFWISDPARHLKIEHEVRMHLWYRLKEKGYGIPFPMRTVEHVSLTAKARRQEAADLITRQEILAKIPLFAPLSGDQHRQLAQGANTVQLAPGQTLFTQDEPGESLYVVHRGKADILIKGTTGATSKVATLGSGDVVGEMSALTGQLRSATVRAASPLSLVEINKRDLQQLINADRTILKKISELIARRNVERDAHLKEVAASTSTAESVKTQEDSLLSRMKIFFLGSDEEK